jgi:nucleoside 2-deoxyribosyltransferase
MKVYIATRLERIAEQQLVVGWLRAAGHEITYDWGAHGPALGKGLGYVAEVARAELNGVLSADIVFALLPGGRGTHFEIGVAVGVGVPVVLWRETSDDGLFEADKRTCAFYHLEAPTVMRVTEPLSADAVVGLLQTAVYASDGGAS